MIPNRGSIWRRWDFHIHTPYSELNNQFGIDPNEESDVERSFDKYVRLLFEKAIESGVAAIGITDYFSIEGYKRIRQEYLENPEKMMELFPDQEMRKKINSLYVFPNIELRLNSFVGDKSLSVNYHVIFSNDVPVSDIEACFLAQLKVRHEGTKTLPCIRDSIEKIGREYRQHNHGNKFTDYRIGLERITVDDSQIMEVLEATASFEGKYLISIPVDEVLSEIKWGGRDYLTRLVLYQQSHLLMTGNPATRDWALAAGHEQEQISEFKSIKPCIWGSDAHCFEEMFCPAEDRYCWIKAEPTFEGLMQILCEPAERVRIQRECPEEKDPHQIIDYIQFDDSDFPKEPILFSEGLTTIIGGKSTGKSLLLRHIANGIDPAQVSKKVASESGPNVNATVTWKDGTTGERKIIYIPQSWLNRIVDERNGNSQLNEMLQDIMLQQDEIGNANRILLESIDRIIKELRHDILDYVAVCGELEGCEKFLKEHGQSSAFKTTIDRLEKHREELSSAAGITDETLQRYTALEQLINQLQSEFEAIEQEEKIITSQAIPFVYIPSITSINNEQPLYTLDTIPFFREQINKAVNEMNESVIKTWRELQSRLQEELSKKKVEIQEAMKAVQEEIAPLIVLSLSSSQIKRANYRQK